MKTNQKNDQQCGTKGNSQNGVNQYQDNKNVNHTSSKKTLLVDEDSIFFLLYPQS